MQEGGAGGGGLAFTPNWYYHYCMVYSVQAGGRKGSRILPNSRAIVLHQGANAGGPGGMKGWLIRAQQPHSKRIYCKGQGGQGVATGKPEREYRNSV